MEKSQENLNESLNKIKYLINYDSSKTRIENTEKIISEQLLPPEQGQQQLPGYHPDLSDYKPNPEDVRPDNAKCPNSITYDDMKKRITGIAHNIRKLNTAFVRMAGERIAKNVYENIKYLNGKNVYDKEFNECSSAIEKSKEYFDSYFQDWFSKGESLEEELSQLIRRPYFRNQPNVLRYLKAAHRIVQSPEEVRTKREKDPRDPETLLPGGETPTPENIPSPNEKPKTQTGSAGGSGGYKFVMGTSNDPFKYGTMGSGIGAIQEILGLPIIDGKWGPNTDREMKKYAPEYAKGFTHADMPNVAKTIRSRKNPESQPIARPENPPIPKVATQPASQSLSQISEEKKKLSEQTRRGEMLGKTVATTAGSIGAGAAAGALMGRAGKATKTSMAALSVGYSLLGSGKASLLSTTAITSVGGAAIAGAAALALTPLVLWLIDKDKARPKVQKLFQYIEENKARIDQVPRGLSDEQIWDASDQLFIAMKRLGARKKQVYDVFNSLKTISDLSALISFYDQDNKIPLMKQLDRDFNMTKDWMKIYRPIRNLVLRFAKEMAQNQTNENPETSVGGASGTYRYVKGTPEDPYEYGTKGHGIVKVQDCLGLKPDGLYGPNTHDRLISLNRTYERFTNDDVATICKLARQERSPITVQGARGKTAGPIANPPKLTKDLSLTNLAPMDNIPSDRMKELTGNVKRGKKYVGEPLSSTKEVDFIDDYISKIKGSK